MMSFSYSVSFHCKFNSKYKSQLIKNDSAYDMSTLVAHFLIALAPIIIVNLFNNGDDVSIVCE